MRSWLLAIAGGLVFAGLAYWLLMMLIHDSPGWLQVTAMVAVIVLAFGYAAWIWFGESTSRARYGGLSDEDLEEWKRRTEERER